MNKHLIILFKVVILYLIFISLTHANKPTVFLVTEHLPPYQIINADNSITGFATEVVLETLKRSQYKYDLNLYSWVRSYNLALNKANTCIFSMARLPIREKLFNWIGPITEKNNAVVWGLKNNDNSQHIETISDLKKYVIAVNKNDATHLGMLKNGFVEGEHLYILEHTKSLLKLLVQRPEIDFIIADDITISHRAKLAGININLLKRVVEIKNLPLNFHLACSIKTDKDILTSLTKILSDIHKDGTYDKILSKWTSKMPHLINTINK